MNLMIKDFPDEVRFKLRLKAFEAGVTFRELVISVMGEWVEGRLKLVGAVEEVPRARKREGKETASSPRPVPAPPPASVRTVAGKGEKMTLGVPDGEFRDPEVDDGWEPEVPQVSNPWDGAYDKIHQGRKKP